MKKNKFTFLPSIKGRETINDYYSIFFCDFETVLLKEKETNGEIYEKQHVICYSILDARGNAYIKKIKNIDRENSIKILGDFLNKVFSLSKKREHNIFYFHNFQAFDLFFIIEYLSLEPKYETNIISRDNKIYQLEVSFNGVNLTFRDSYLLLPYSLERAGTYLLGENNEDLLKKKSFNYADITVENLKSEEFKSSVLDLCINDTRILKNTFLRFRSIIFSYFKVDPVENLTYSSLSLKIFRTKFFEKAESKIEILKGNKHEFIRKSYLGGIVDVYRPFLKKGYYYDVNSLYPFVMKTSKMPTGVGIYRESIPDLDNFFGFVKAKIQAPVQYIPALPFRCLKRGLISPNGDWSGIYFSEELKYAKSLGYIIEPEAGYEYEPQIIFDNFVNSCFKLRSENKENLGLNTLLKLIMVSLYGRFGMKPDATQTAFINKDELDSYLLNTRVLNYTLHNKKYIVNFEKKLSHSHIVDLLDEHYIDIDEFIKIQKSQDSHTSLVSTQIASAVTSYARIHMHKLKLIFSPNLYYSDTDSLFLDCPVPDSYVSDEIGKLKLVANITDGIFLAPKIYLFHTESDEIRTVFKGIPKEHQHYEYLQKLLDNPDEGVLIEYTNDFVRIKKNKWGIFKKKIKTKIVQKMKKRNKLFMGSK